MKLLSHAHFFVIAILAFVVFAQSSSCAEAPVKGQVIVESSFDTDAELAAWQGDKHLDSGMNGGKALRVERVAGAANASASLRLPIPVENLRGCVLRGMVMVKAENVSAKPNSWNGIKVMLPIETPDRKLWPQAPVDTGTFDWTRVSFTAKIPSDATALSLVLGMEQVTGKVWFDNLKLTVAKIPPGPKPPPAPGPMFRGHDLPRLRGTMISPNIDEDGLRTLGRDWNANLIRWQLIRNSKSADYDAWLDAELKRLDAALPLCEKYELYVALDLHSPPGGKMTSGGYAGSDGGLFTDHAAQDKFVEVWKKLAARYKNARAIWGFDLANEPVEDQVGEDCDDWHDLAERAAKAIRAIDPARTLIVEAPPWGSPESLADFIPLSVSNCVYSAHMYVPHEFTHQDVHTPAAAPLTYPGVIKGKRWDKAALAAALKPVADFQRAYNAHIYIGEFSAIRWAPGDSAANYLRDVIEICEEHGWDWSYHAFREWNGWSVEHGSVKEDSHPAAQPTDRQRLLMEWFKKNQKPAWMAK